MYTSDPNTVRNGEFVELWFYGPTQRIHPCFQGFGSDKVGNRSNTVLELFCSGKLHSPNRPERRGPVVGGGGAAGLGALAHRVLQPRAAPVQVRGLRVRRLPRARRRALARDALAGTIALQFPPQSDIYLLYQERSVEEPLALCSSCTEGN